MRGILAFALVLLLSLSAGAHGTVRGSSVRVYPTGMCSSLDLQSLANELCMAADVDYIEETELDSEAELEAQLADVTNVIIGTEIDTEAELEALVGVSFLATTELDSEAELETMLGSVNVLLATEVDTEAELETLLTDTTNVIVSTEIDTKAELEALIGTSINYLSVTRHGQATGGVTASAGDCIRPDNVSILTAMHWNNIHLCGIPFDSTITAVDLTCGFGFTTGWDTGDRVDICLSELSEANAVSHFSPCIVSDEADTGENAPWVRGEVKSVTISASWVNASGFLAFTLQNVTDTGTGIDARITCNATYYYE